MSDLVAKAHTVDPVPWHMCYWKTCILCLGLDRARTRQEGKRTKSTFWLQTLFKKKKKNTYERQVEERGTTKSWTQSNATLIWAWIIILKYTFMPSRSHKVWYTEKKAD
jgi:hypothetical protein